MDLLAKVVVVALIVVVVAAVVILLGTKISVAKQQLNATQAQSFVLTYIKKTYPNTQAYPINVSRSTLVNGSWDVFVGIVYNYSRPCPTIEIEDYDYPAVNLYPRTDNVYSSGGVGCKSSTNLYAVNLPSAAMADAYMLATGARQYVQRFGYSNVTATAVFVKNTTQTSFGTFSDFWNVTYTAPHAGFSEYILLYQSGEFIGNYTSTQK